MGKFQDLTGKRFGKLVVLSKKEKGTARKSTRWLCRCDCGNDHLTTSTNLRVGDCKSCGCYRIENSRNNNPNKKHSLRYHPLYRVWCGIRYRCSNPNEPGYKYYGAKGIKVCDEWLNDVNSFIKWGMENGYSKGLTIDRIDSKGNYEPDNCQWLTRIDNSKKRWADKKC
jgi:hypothetical protein